jgi:putative membrane protein
MTGGSKLVRVTAALAVWAALGACSKGDDNAAADSPAAGTTAAATDTGAHAGHAAGTMTDPNIVAVLDRANANDSSGGMMAQNKGTHADVKAFGKLMMSEHHALRQRGQDLAKAQNVTPEPPATDPLQAMHDSAAQALNAMPKGHQWDHAYISHEIAMHEAVLATAQQAQGMAQNAQLKQLITEAGPVIQKHLDRAREIQKTLTAAGAPGSAPGTKAPAAGTGGTKTP